MYKFKIYLLALTLIISLNACSDDPIIDDDHDHYEANGVHVYKDGILFMKILNTVINPEWASEINVALNSEKSTYNIVFLDEDGKELPLPDDEHLNLGFLITNPQIAEIEIIDAKNFKFKFKPLIEGTTEVEIRLLHNDHPDFKTPKIPLKVR